MKDPIVEALEAWDRLDKHVNMRYTLQVYDTSKEPRPQGRYLLLTWDGKMERTRLYHSAWRRKLGVWAHNIRVKMNSSQVETHHWRGSCCLECEADTSWCDFPHTIERD